MGKESPFLVAVNAFIEDRYSKIVDSEGSLMFDVIEKHDVEDLIWDGSLVKIKVLEDFHDLKFPCSYRYLRSLWENVFKETSFDNKVSQFVVQELFSVKKVSNSIFFNKDIGILRSNLDLKEDADFMVFYASRRFKDLMNEVKGFFRKKSEYIIKEEFGWDYMGKNFNRFFNRLRSDMRSYRSRITVNLESFEDDKSSKKVDIALVVQDKYLESIGERRVKERMSKLISYEHVSGVEVYKDNSISLYLGLTLSRKMSVSNLSDLSALIVYYYTEIFSDE